MTLSADPQPSSDAGSQPAAVVTRDESPREGRLGTALRRAGATVLHWPVTEIVGPADPGPLRAAVAELAVYDWVVFTSRRGVAALAKLADRLPSTVRVATVGAKTAEAVRAAGWSPELVAGETSEELADALLARLGGDPARLLFPTTPRAGAVLPDRLEANGHRMDRVEAYRTAFRPLDAVECARAARDGGVGVVTFTSPSAVEGLRRALPRELFRELTEGAVAVSIGPTTTAALDEVGWPCHESETRSLEGVARAALHRLREAGHHPRTESRGGSDT